MLPCALRAVVGNESLYRGTVWIDRRSFAKVRVQAVQTRTSAPIVSNEEMHNYAAVAELEGSPVFLLTRHTARQIVLIAGRNLLLEKASTFTRLHRQRRIAFARRAARHTTASASCTATPIRAFVTW